MILPIHDLFETHLTVADLQRSMAFYGGVLGLDLARVFPERKVAFYWIRRVRQGHAGIMGSGKRSAADEAAPGFHRRSSGLARGAGAAAGGPRHSTRLCGQRDR